MFGKKIISQSEYEELKESKKMMKTLYVKLQEENLKSWGKEDYDLLNKMIDENPSISNKELLDNLEKYHSTKLQKRENQ